jgi:hypothetical protein
VAERLHLLRPFRWRLAEVPLGLDHPYWVDDERFDLEFHVRELALPAPGSESQLSEQVARIFARQLNRSRPLWELYVIEGLAGGRVAVFTKIHHAAVDGLSGAEILSVLLDVSPEGRYIEPPPATNRRGERVPGDLEMLGRGIAGLPRQPLRIVTARLAVTRGLEAPTNLVISNVPGSPVPMFLAGARLEAQYPVSAIIDGVGINITVLSYRDQLDFGIVVDREMVDDAWDLIGRLKLAHEELLALVPPPAQASRNGAAPAKARRRAARA